MTDPIDHLLAALARIADGDHAARLRKIAAARVELDRLTADYAKIRAAEIRAARAGLTWREIGEIFGVSLQRAHEYGAQHQHQQTGPTT